MTNLILIFSLLLMSLNAWAQSSNAKILEKDQYLEFARGNKIFFKKGTEVNYRDDGSILFVFSDQRTDKLATWTTKKGIVYNFHCGAKLFRSSGDIHGASLIWFHPSGEYQRGCVSVSTPSFSTPQVTGSMSFNSVIELSEEGELIYLSSVHSGYAEVFNKTLQLAQRKEINFHPDGSLRFFTPAKNQTYVSPSRYGDVVFGQRTPEVSISLFENGMIERGILAKSKRFNGINVPARSGLIFDDSTNPSDPYPFIYAVLLDSNYTFESNDGYSVVTRSFKFHEKGYVSLVEVAEKFVFIRPDDNKEVRVQVGDLVHFDENKVVSKIEFRVQR